MKPPRLQFSLRMLLLLMAVVGVALTIYRWPWVEETESLTALEKPADGSDSQREFRLVTRTTYRRDWRGQAVKHGPLQSFRNGQLWHEANFYEGELHGLRRVWDAKDRLALEAHYAGGKLHGPYRSWRGSQWLEVGQCVQDKMDGEWRKIYWRTGDIYPDFQTSFADFVGPDYAPVEFVKPSTARILGKQIPEDPAVIISQWRLGKRHGTITWKTLDGELLNTAQYEDDRFVGWNGQPVVAQVRSWLESLPDCEPARLLLRADNRDWDQKNLVDDEMAFDITVADMTAERLLIHLESKRLWWWYLDSRGQSLLASLCELAAREGYGFDDRYGGLWLVPREADPSPPFIDPTGVDRIQFARGSSQEREWLERVSVMSHEGLVASCLQHVLGETSIACDFSAIGGLGDPNQFSIDPELLFTRTRRDVVGLVLYRAGFRCEQRGNALHILPRWTNPPRDPLEGPLSGLRHFHAL